MATGKEGLKARVMGTTLPQSADKQSNFICKEVFKTNPISLLGISANNAIEQSKETEFVLDLAHQINDHPRTGFVLFSEAMDAWILEVSEMINPAS